MTSNFIEAAGPKAVAMGGAAIVATGVTIILQAMGAGGIPVLTQLRPAMAALQISEEFVGLVIVAIAGNAVENVVGITAAARNEPDLGVSLILNSSLQVALLLIPALVIISMFLGGPMLTLVAPPLLVTSLGLAAVLGALIVGDGEPNYLEGLALVGLYIIIAGSVWFGPPLSP